MSVILHMEPQPRRKGSYVLTLDDGRTFSAHEEVIVKYRLKSGMEVDEDRLRDWILEADTKIAYDLALHYLGIYARSRKQLCDYLTRKGFGEEAIEAAADKLEEYRFLDDADFAARYIRDRKSGKPMGRRRMLQELRSKGVSDDILETALDGYSEEEERESALRLGEKVARKAGALSPEAFRLKVGQTLQRRGFDWEIVRYVLRRLQKDGDDGDGMD